MKSISKYYSKFYPVTKQSIYFLQRNEKGRNQINYRSFQGPDEYFFFILKLN
jgi:hypothetical protein